MDPEGVSVPDTESQEEGYSRLASSYTCKIIYISLHQLLFEDPIPHFTTEGMNFPSPAKLKGQENAPLDAPSWPT